MVLKRYFSGTKIALCFAAAVMAALLPAASACLSAEDIVAAYNLEESLNLTGHPIYNLLESVCNKATGNTTGPDLTLYATKAELLSGYVSNASMGNFVTFETMDSRISSAMQIISQANVEDRVDNQMKNYTDSLEKRFHVDELLYYLLNNTERMLSNTNTTAWATIGDMQTTNSYIQSHESRLSNIEAEQARQKEQSAGDPGGLIFLVIGICVIGGVLYFGYIRPRQFRPGPGAASAVPPAVMGNYNEDRASAAYGRNLLKILKPELNRPAARPTPQEVADATVAVIPEPEYEDVPEEEPESEPAPRQAYRPRPVQGPPAGRPSIIPKKRR